MGPWGRDCTPATNTASMKKFQPAPRRKAHGADKLVADFQLVIGARVRDINRAVSGKRTLPPSEALPIPPTLTLKFTLAWRLIEEKCEVGNFKAGVGVGGCMHSTWMSF